MLPSANSNENKEESIDFVYSYVEDFTCMFGNKLERNIMISSALYNWIESQYLVIENDD